MIDEDIEDDELIAAHKSERGKSNLTYPRDTIRTAFGKRKRKREVSEDDQQFGNKTIRK